MTRAQEERLQACGEWQARAACEPGVYATTRPCAQQNRAPAMLRTVARPVTIRNTGWYLLLDKVTGERIGSAYWTDGMLCIYGPPWPGRRRSANGLREKTYQVKRTRAAWARVIRALGGELRDDESPGEGLARVEKTEQFRGVVK